MAKDEQRDLPHAVASTGPDVQVLPGGRSRLTTNGVPILELSHKSLDKVLDSVDNLHDENQETELLVGARVLLHNPSPKVMEPGADVIVFTIGGETLDEAAKSVVGLFEAEFGLAAPTWVASTNEHLAEVIADHYGSTEIRDITEASA